MNQRLAFLALVLAAPLSLGACGQVQDSASSAASDAAREALKKWPGQPKSKCANRSASVLPTVR